MTASLCNAPLHRFRGDVARCNLPFAHFGQCRLRGANEFRAHNLRVLSTHAARRGNTWSQL